jgi:trehalose/maltose hydrolase-like predicted phosphorylase
MIEPDSSGERTDPAWTVTVEDRPRLERVAESLCSLADGRFGTRGAREEDGAGSSPLTAAAGVYHDPGAGPTLLPGPVWTGLEIAPSCGGGTQQLDLRAGLLRRRWETTDGAVVRSLRFASLARLGVVGLRAEGPAGALGAGPALLVPGGEQAHDQASLDGAEWARTWATGGGGITAAAGQRTTADGRSRLVERLAVYLADPDRAPAPEAAVERLRAVEAVGFDRLLSEHRAAWAARWAGAEVAIEGDPDAQLAVRFALFHLLASAADNGEAAVGARG